MNEITEIYNYIDDNLKSHIANIQKFLRQPSISQTGEGIQDCAELLKIHLIEMGFNNTRLVDMGYYEFGDQKIKCHPIVFGNYDAGADKTLLIYTMYDCMPISEKEKWLLPPFKAELTTMHPFKEVVIARGAYNSKGPLMAFLNACDSIKNVTGELPVNIIFVAEGEEERLSNGLKKFVNKYSRELDLADAMYFPMGKQDMNGVAKPNTGSEGYAYIELETSGKRWGKGPTEFDIHGGRKRTVDSPAWRHIKMLSSMTSGDGNKVVIDGWYDNLEPPTETDIELITEAAKYYNPDLDKKVNKIKHFINNEEDPLKLLKMDAFSSILNIDGIWGGGIGAGAGSILPARLISKHSIRIVPNQEPNEILSNIRKYLDKNGYEDVELRVHGGYTWCRGDPKSEIAKAAYAMYEKFGVKYVISHPFSFSGNFAPAWPCCLFGREPLDMPFISAAIGHGNRAHSPNEFYVIDSGYKGKYGMVYGLSGAEKGFCTLLYNYAGKK